MSLSTIETVGDMVEKYYERTQARQSENTLGNRKVALSQFLDYFELDESDDVEVLCDVEQYHIEDWIDSMFTDEYAPRTVRNKVYCISSFYGYCAERPLIDENPVEDVDTSEYTGNRIDEFSDSRYIEVEEYEEMLDCTHKKRNEVLLRLMWNTGVRAKEAIGITRDDIDLDGKSIRIVNAKTSETKTAKKRTVYISRRLATMIKRWYEGERNAYLGVGGEDDEGHLLVTKQSPQMAVGRVTEIIGEIAERAGIQEVFYKNQAGEERRRVTAHAFRHSYCVHRVKQGMPLVYLQNLCGHADISQTREYLRFRDDDTEEAERNYRPRV